MNKLFVSAGLVAIGAAAFQSSTIADDITGGATGPKYWNVSATLRGFYDDNYNIVSPGKGSFGIEILPSVSVHVPLRQTDLGVRYTYGAYWYHDRQIKGVNPWDQTHDVDLWVDHSFNERWQGKFSDTFASGQEPGLLTPNPTTGSLPYRVNGDNISNHGNAELDTDWTRLLSTSLSYGNGYYDYDNSGAAVIVNGLGVPVGVITGGIPGPSLGGLLNRDEENVALDLKWHLQPDTTVYLGYKFAWVNYLGNEPIAVAIGGPRPGLVYHSSDRDSYEHVVYLGVKEQFTPNLTADVSAGGSATDTYNDPLNSNTEWNPYANVSASYTYLPGSFVQLGFSHDISASDQVSSDSSGNITQYSEDSVVYLDINHKITEKLLATAIGRIQYQTYHNGAVGNDDTTDYSVGVTLTYTINTHLSVDVGYNYDNVQSDIVGYGFSRNRYYLGLTATY